MKLAFADDCAPSRRKFLKTAAAGTAVLAAPTILSTAARASSGEVNVLIWEDEMPPAVLAGFTAQTGIRVNVTGFSSLQQLMAELQQVRAVPFDLCTPSSKHALLVGASGRLQTLDMNRIPYSNLNPSLAERGMRDWSFNGRGPCWIAHVWGTEGIAWRTDLWNPPGPVSYGDIWEPGMAGQAMGKADTMLIGAGLHMEEIGLLAPGAVWEGFASPDALRAMLEKVLDWCLPRRNNFAVLWEGFDDQIAAMRDGAVTVAQTWDGPMLSLKESGLPIAYRAPEEGALTWIDGLSLTAAARNIDQAYALIAYLLKPEVAGLGASIHGYNPAVQHAEAFAGDTYAANFAAAYPGMALARLNPWPVEQPWHHAIWDDFARRFAEAQAG